MGDHRERDGYRERREECRDRAEEKRDNLDGRDIPQWRKEDIVNDTYARCMDQYRNRSHGGYLEYGYPYPQPPVVIVPRQPQHPDANCTPGTGECSWEQDVPPPDYTPPLPHGEYNGPER